MDEEIKIPEEDTKVSGSLDTGLTVYEINQQIFSKAPVLTEEQIENKKDVIRHYAHTNKTDSNYFMLLSNELHYYTLFYRKDRANNKYPLISDEVIECLKWLGAIVAIDYDSNSDCVECWIKDDENQAKMLLFFAYDDGVIECQ